MFETPLFQRLLDAKRIEPAPVAEVIRRNWKEILQSAFLRLSEQAPFYMPVGVGQRATQPSRA